MDTPQMHPPCRTDRRGFQPHQTLPQLYSQMTTMVVKMQVGYYLNSKKYISQTHHTSQGLQEVLTCQNGTPFPWNLLGGDYSAVWNPQPLGHVSFKPAKEMQSEQASRDQEINSRDSYKRVNHERFSNTQSELDPPPQRHRPGSRHGLKASIDEKFKKRNT
jgi:hypothetical protein